MWNSGILGEALIGGRYVWDNQIITGIEVGFLIDSNRLRHNFAYPNPPDVTPFASQFKRKYAITPSFILGYAFCPRWNAFLKLGMSFSQFKIRVDNVLDQLTFKNTKRKTGFMPGIGVEYAMNCAVSFQGTVSYEHYSKIKKTFQPVLTNSIVADAFYTARVKSPQYYTAKLGVLIKM